MASKNVRIAEQPAARSASLRSNDALATTGPAVSRTKTLNSPQSSSAGNAPLARTTTANAPLVRTATSSKSATPVAPQQVAIELKPAIKKHKRPKPAAAAAHKDDEEDTASEGSDVDEDVLQAKRTATAQARALEQARAEAIAAMDSKEEQ